MKKLNLKEINGNEIIDFLNSLNPDDYPEINDISIVHKSFVFEDQTICDDRYVLYFKASYNNWGIDQEFEYNKLVIYKDNLWVNLEEPFEGDGTDTILENILSSWIENHTFIDQSELFISELKNVYDQLPEITISDVDKMNKIIETLTKAKSFMKKY